jgi:glycosyltransferase involved in cell wall biosynthesis
VGREPGTATLERLGLAPGEYVLYVSRLEPENNADAVIVGFEQAALAQKLVVVGDAPYADAYKARLRQLAGERVVLAGGVYGQGYRELQSHAFAYVHATEVGGTHPALVEAMGFGNCVIVNDVPENREVAGAAGLYFKASDPPTLARVLERLVSEADLLERHRGLARQRAAEHYSWDAVTDAYLRLFESLLPSRAHAS